jgi:large subunit ribosomal protein L28
MLSWCSSSCHYISSFSRARFVRGIFTPAISTFGGFASSLLASGFSPNQKNVTFPFAIQQRHRSNRSRRGLYDGKDVGFGNKVSHSERKTRRKFKPNVFLKRLYSEVLNKMLRFHVTASALRSIDKAGGLDRYLLKSKHVQEGEGMAAKLKILEKMERIQAKKAAVSHVNKSPSSDDKSTKDSVSAEINH